MRLLVTGSNGTLAPKLAAAARARGWEVVGWDRHAVDPDAAVAGQRWLDTVRPNAIAHLAMGAEAWAARLADWARSNHRPFVFTSTAMVFDHQPDGPHHPGDFRSARDDYGRYKIRCEDAVRAANPGATLARIGWQIDPHAVGNNMLAHLDQWQQRDGRVRASHAWTPACSFMQDTADALLTLIDTPVAGAVHLDSNASEAFTFEQIARALQRAFDRRQWIVEAHDEYRHDQRLGGGAGRMPPLSQRLVCPVSG